MVTCPGCIPASRLTAGIDSSSLMTLIRNKCHTRWMEVMLQTPNSLSPRLTGIRLSNHHALAAPYAEGRTCFADFQPALPICSLVWLILCPNAEENTFMFIHPASGNCCPFLIRVMRVLESILVGTGHEAGIHPRLVTSPGHTHTHLPRGS